MTIIVAIDGPSGVGKGTLSRKLAQKLNFSLLDSGMIYRLVALEIINQKLDVYNVQDLISFLKKFIVNFQNCNNNFQTYLKNKNIFNEIRLEKTGMMASKIASINLVRKTLLQLQRNFAVNVSGLIADGRDMGTVVFPEAKFKFFLDASIEIRAQRRYKEIFIKSRHSNFSKILAKLKRRDSLDYNRCISPLKPADNAFIIDTSDLSGDEVFMKVLQYIT